MTARSVIDLAKKLNVNICLTSAGKIKCEGDQHSVGELFPLIKQNKSKIICFLQQPPVEPSPKPCPICEGLDFVHGDQGGFCTICQPDARPGKPATTRTELKKLIPFIDYGDGEPGQGGLVIPYGCPERYKYWAGGQSIWATLKELNAPGFVVQKYVDRKLTPTAYAEWQEQQAVDEPTIKGDNVVWPKGE